MKALILYDSVYQNTEKIAQAIGTAFPPGTVTVIKADAAEQSDLDGVTLLIAGSPTQGGRAVASLQEFLTAIPADGLKNIGVAAFDTRMTGEKNGFGIRLLVKILGYAAGRIAAVMASKGGKLIISAEGFAVEGREGPLKPGETERAAAWGKQIINKMKSL